MIEKLKERKKQSRRDPSMYKRVIYAPYRDWNVSRVGFARISRTPLSNPYPSVDQKVR